MKNKAAFVALVMVLSLVAGTGIAKMSGYWRTESSKVPAKITDGEFAGENNPGDIRGSYSFADIEAAFGVPPDMMAAAFGLQGNDPAAFQAKSLEESWGELDGGIEVGTDSIRLFVALWTGLPYSPDETTVLPAPAVEILEAYGHIDSETAARLGRMAPELSGRDVIENTSADQEIPDRMVRGKTTFGDLRDWGVSDEKWREIIGVEMGSRSAGLKDWSDETGLSMSEIKPLVQQMVDEGA